MASAMVQVGGKRASKTFRVSLIVLVRDGNLRGRIVQHAETLGQPEPVEGHDELFRFSVDFVRDEGELEKLLALFFRKETPGRFLLISDRLTEPLAAGGHEAGELAGRVRRQFRESHHLCGLIALQDGTKGRVSDIDRVVETAGFRVDSLRREVIRAALGLRMKSRPPHRKSVGVDLRLDVVQSPDQLARCFALRHRVYDMMGYLPDEVASDPCRMEIDSYDDRAVHFAAARTDTGEVVGASRLVLSMPDNGGSHSSGFRPRVLDVHSGWSKEIARGAGWGTWRRVRSGPFMPLPILQSTEFQSNWPEVLREAVRAAELSRLVVAPAWRGNGLSRDLVRAAIVKTWELRRNTLLLECIPNHEEMYSKYGFRRLPGHPYSRPTDLDQYAVAMRLQLDGGGRAAEAAEKVSRRARAGGYEFRRIALGRFDVPDDAIDQE